MGPLLFLLSQEGRQVELLVHLRWAECWQKLHWYLFPGLAFVGAPSFFFLERFSLISFVTDILSFPSFPKCCFNIPLSLSLQHGALRQHFEKININNISKKYGLRQYRCRPLPYVPKLLVASSAQIGMLLGPQVHPPSLKELVSVTEEKSERNIKLVPLSSSGT